MSALERLVKCGDCSSRLMSEVADGAGSLHVAIGEIPDCVGQDIDGAI